MALSASSILHDWSARHGPTPTYGGTPVHTRSSAGRIADQRGVIHAPIINTPRIGWDTVSGERRPTMLLELARTNIVLQSRDLGNTGSWTKVNTTAVRDQIGVDGSQNTGTKVSATAANGTILQTTTLASSARYQTAYVRRITGSGTINMTMDGGTTWTAITVTDAWTRVSIPTQTLANPHVGFRIVTSGDAIAVDFVQNENGTFSTSPIPTTTAAATRSADSFYWDFTADLQAMMIYCRFVEGGTASTAGSRILQLGATTGQFLIFQDGTLGTYKIYWDDGTNARSSVPGVAVAVGDTVEMVMVLQSTGAIHGIQSINGGAVATGSVSATLALPASLVERKLWLGSSNAGDVGASSFAEVKIVKYADVVASTAQGIMDELRDFAVNSAGEVLA